MAPSRKPASKPVRMGKIKMFPSESYDPLLSGRSSGRFSSDVGKGGELTANHGLDTATAARPWRRHTPPRTTWLGAEKRWRICDVWNYRLATHMYMIFGVVGNQGSIQTDIEVGVAKREVSDEGVLPGGSSIVQRISKFSLFPNRRSHLGALLWHIDGL